MEKIRSEYVVRIEGNIRARKDPNKKIPTGMVELEADAVTILNAVHTNLPFLPAEESLQLSEEVRLKHRVLDLRYSTSLDSIATQCSYWLRQVKIIHHAAAMNSETSLLSCQCKWLSCFAQSIVVDHLKSRGL